MYCIEDLEWLELLWNHNVLGKRKTYNDVTQQRWAIRFILWEVQLATALDSMFGPKQMPGHSGIRYMYTYHREIILGVQKKGYMYMLQKITATILSLERIVVTFPA